MRLFLLVIDALLYDRPPELHKTDVGSTPGTPGELCVAGYLCQRGYWADPDQTAQAYRADDDDPTGTMWMHTGDTAIMDEEGYVRSECLEPVPFKQVTHCIIFIATVVGRNKVRYLTLLRCVR